MPSKTHVDIAIEAPLAQFHTLIERVGTFGAVSANAGGCEHAPRVNPVILLALRGVFCDGKTAPGGGPDGSLN